MSGRQTNKKLAIDMVTVLTQPPVPPALHYVNLRTIMGEFEWNKLKKQYRLLADHHCMICQRYVSHTAGDWLELHEQYEYDFVNLIQTLTGYVSICHECHMYIHTGFWGLQLQQGTISLEKYQQVITKGDALLQEFGLQKIVYPSDACFYDPEWKLSFGGMLYQSH